jgi:hypothetical protein
LPFAIRHSPFAILYSQFTVVTRHQTPEVTNYHTKRKNK